MARIRTIKPEFFRHEALYDAEVETGLPLRLAFAGLWTVCDREGRFEWRPRALKHDVLPYDDCDFGEVMDELAKRGFVLRYRVAGHEYGYIPSWEKHQVINPRERKSEIPHPDDNNCTDALPPDDADKSTRESNCTDACPTREGNYRGELEGKGTGREREVEGKKRESAPQADAPPSEPDPVSKPVSKPKPVRGSRWPADRQVPDDWLREGEVRRVENGLVPIDLRLEAEKFRNYWASKAGGHATKVDWHLTWTNWVLRADAPRKNGQANGKTPVSQIAAELIADIRSRNRGANRGEAHGARDSFREAGDGGRGIPGVAPELLPGPEREI